MSVWEAFEKKVNSTCDLSHAAASNYSLIFLSVYHIFRKLRHDHPSWIVDTCLLVLPAARPLGKCVLMPGGLGVLPIPKLSESSLSNLVTTMETSKTLDEVAGSAANDGNPKVGSRLSMQRTDKTNSPP